MVGLVLLNEFGAFESSDESQQDRPSGILSDLESQDAATRLRAVQSLRTTRDSRCAQLLVERLKDPNELVAVAAAEELAKLGDRSVVPELLQLYGAGARLPAAIALADLAGKEEEAFVLEMFGHSDATIRRCGAKALARIGAPAATHQAALTDPDEGVRIIAARQIARSVPRREALDLMEQALNHPSPPVRRTAAIELAAFKADAVPVLRSRADDPDASVKSAVSATLKRIEGMR